MKVGSIGTGNIVEIMLSAMEKAEGITCCAVYSRSEEKGQKLAKRFGIQKVYTCLEDMLHDAELDCIYIASPNSLHYSQAKQALQCGKHVICEKPFTSTVAQTKELIQLAKKQHLFLLEAITTMYLPNYQLLKEHLSHIGSIKMIQCSYCQLSSRYPLLQAGQLPNTFNPAFSGGALMDINLYNIYFVVGLLGKPLQVNYFPTRHENGIDLNGILIMQYPHTLCQCTGAKDMGCENSVHIMGEKGWIYLPGSNGCQQINIHTQEGKIELNAQTGTQWENEVRGLADLMLSDNYEECYRRLDTTLTVMEVLEEARKSAGLHFPDDDWTTKR